MSYFPSSPLPAHPPASPLFFLNRTIAAVGIPASLLPDNTSCCMQLTTSSSSPTSSLPKSSSPTSSSPLPPSSLLSWPVSFSPISFQFCFSNFVDLIRTQTQKEPSLSTLQQRNPSIKVLASISTSKYFQSWQKWISEAFSFLHTSGHSSLSVDRWGRLLFWHSHHQPEDPNKRK